MDLAPWRLVLGQRCVLCVTWRRRCRSVRAPEGLGPFLETQTPAFEGAVARRPQHPQHNGVKTPAHHRRILGTRAPLTARLTACLR
jgi:hypothetical protein